MWLSFGRNLVWLSGLIPQASQTECLWEVEAEDQKLINYVRGSIQRVQNSEARMQKAAWNLWALGQEVAVSLRAATT